MLSRIISFLLALITCIKIAKTNTSFLFNFFLAKDILYHNSLSDLCSNIYSKPSLT